MAILLNSRHEKFSQLVASGIQPAAAYRSLEELIGKHRGMFIDRQVAEVAISSEPSIAEVLRGETGQAGRAGEGSC